MKINISNKLIIVIIILLVILNTSFINSKTNTITKYKNQNKLKQSIQSENLIWNLYHNNNDPKPFLSCPIKINFTTTNCQLGNDSVAAGLLKITLDIDEQQDFEDQVDKDIKNDNVDPKDLILPPKDNGETKKTGDKQPSIIAIPEDMVPEDAKTKKFRFKQNQEDIKGEPREDDIIPPKQNNGNEAPKTDDGNKKPKDNNNNNKNLSGAQMIPDDSEKSEGNDKPKFNNEITLPQKLTNISPCKSEWMRWTLDGLIDTRYLSSCRVTINTIPNNNVVKFTLTSRETQEQSTVSSEIIIPSKISDADVKAYFKIVEDSCEETIKAVKQVKLLLGEKHCKKFTLYTEKMDPKNIVNKQEAQKYKNMVEDLKKNKQEKATLTKEVDTIEAEKNACYSKLSNKNMEIKQNELEMTKDNAELATLQESLGSAQSQIEALKIVADNHADRVEEAKKEKEAVDSEQAKLNNIAQQASKKANRYQEAEGKLDKANQDKQKKDNATKAKQENAMGNYEKERDTITSAKNAKAKTDKTAKELEDKIESATDDLNKDNNQKAKLKDKLKDLQDQLNEIQEQGLPEEPSNYDDTAGNENNLTHSKATKELTNQWNKYKSSNIPTFIKGSLKKEKNACFMNGKCDFIKKLKERYSS